MSESKTVDLDSLFDEDNLAQIYRKAPSFFSNKFNAWAFVVTATTLAAFSTAHVLIPSFRDSIQIPFADTFNLWANLGVSLSATILGFLIAGFAVVCTVLRPQTMIALHKITNPKYKQTELKLLFVFFIDILVQYLALLFVSVVASIVGGKSGPVAAIGKILTHVHWIFPFAILHILFVCWGTWLVMLVLILKSFIYNLYQNLLLGLADTVDDYERQRLTVRCERSDVSKPDNLDLRP